ncbi:MAG TPA: hypothetical protein VKE74_27885 [Gemmataceae bacterium]|nr:hypothetical protein [Gemmataceae bacterium]
MSRLHSWLAAGLVLAVIGGSAAAGDDPDQKALVERTGARIGEALPDAAQFAVLLAQVEGLKAENRDLKGENRSLKEDLAVTRAALAKAVLDDAVVAELLEAGAKLQKNLQAALDELDAVRNRSAKLEEERKEYASQLQHAKAAQLAAEKEAKAARLREEELTKKVEVLAAEAKKPQPGGPGASPPPLPEGIRGSVTAYKDGLAVLSIGLDAGLQKGTELDVYRIEGGSTKSLGKAVVTDVYPKCAVANFKPVGGKPLKQLQPDELPKVGDMAGRKPDR